MANDYIIKDCQLENTGGGCMVLFIDISKQMIVNLQQPELKQISYDGDTFAGLNVRYQDTEEGIESENQLFVAYSWIDLIDAVGIRLALEMRKRIISDWKWTDHCDKRTAIDGLVNLIELVDKAMLLTDNYSELLTVGYPFSKDIEHVTVDLIHWQQAVMNKYSK